MKILLDENLDHRLRTQLPGHDVFTVLFMGWDGLKNGTLLRAAEQASFDVLITGDQTLSYEQNLVGMRLAVIALSTVEWRLFRHQLGKIDAAINQAIPGSFQLVDCGTFARRRTQPDG